MNICIKYLYLNVTFLPDPMNAENKVYSIQPQWRDFHFKKQKKKQDYMFFFNIKPVLIPIPKRHPSESSLDFPTKRIINALF